MIGTLPDQHTGVKRKDSRPLFFFRMTASTALARRPFEGNHSLIPVSPHDDVICGIARDVTPCRQRAATLVFTQNVNHVLYAAWQPNHLNEHLTLLPVRVAA